MLVTPEEKEKLDKMLAEFIQVCETNNRYGDTMIEMIHFFNGLVEELKETNPALSLRVVNKVSDIVNRGILNK